MCAAPGCVTRLSIYNLGSTCWQHAALNFPNYRGKRLRKGGVGSWDAAAT